MIRRAYRWAGWVGLALVAIGAGAQTDDVDREFEFASKLVEIGFADYAERLIDQLVVQNPSLKDRGRVVRIEILANRRKFDEAEKLLAEMPKGDPKTQAARLALANQMYRYREVERARKHYEEFFKEFKSAPTDPDLKRFYVDAAYRFSQMLLRAGDVPGAIQSMENILKAKPEPGIERRIQIELIQLLIQQARGKSGKEQEDLLKRAWDLAEKITWGREGIDVPFCQAIVAMANIELLRGKPQAAIKLLRNNMDLMKGIDEILKQERLPTSESPMAYARFLLGELYEKDARSAQGDAQLQGFVQAITQYVNVFAKYPDSDWAAESVVRAEALQRLVREKFKREVRIDWGQHLPNVVAALRKVVDDLYLQKKYAEVVPQALRVLNIVPTAPELGPVYTPLLISLVETSNPLYLTVALDHIADTRENDPSTGLALLALAKHFFDKKDTNNCVRIYGLFADVYPKHERVPQVLFLGAQMLKKQGDRAKAREWLQRVIANYPQDQFYLHALSTLAWDYYEAKEYEKAADAFAKYLQDCPPSHGRALAMFGLGDAQMRLGRHLEAAATFQKLAEWLQPKENNPYAKTADELKKAAELSEKAIFYRAYALFQAPGDEAQRKKAAEEARQVFENFVAQYKKSELAPKALGLIGAIYMQQGRMDEASKVFDRLRREYPDSEEGKSAQFAQIRAAMEIKRFDLAEEALKAMLTAEPPGKPPKLYTPEQFTQIGQWLLDAERFALAMQAFEWVVKSGTNDRKVLEPSLYGLGVAAYKAGNKEKAIEALEDLLVRYPRTGLFFEARLLLAKIYRELGRYPDSVATLKEVFTLAQDSLRVSQANIELASVYREFAGKLKAQGKDAAAAENLRSAAASYERVALFGKEQNEAERPLVELAMREVVTVLEELGLFNDAIEAAERYLTKFGDRPEAAAVRGQLQALRLKAAAAPATSTPPSSAVSPGRNP